MKCEALYCEKEARFKVMLPASKTRPEETVHYCEDHAKGMVEYADAEVLMELERDRE